MVSQLIVRVSKVCAATSREMAELNYASYLHKFIRNCCSMFQTESEVIIAYILHS